MTTRPAADQPTVYVIAGPNGAGKTTFATQVLPKRAECREFLNADLIAAGLAPFAPDSQSIRAGRLLLERFEELANSGQTFGFETTLAGKSYLPKLRDLKAKGYEILAHYLWLPSADFAVARVANRVQQGGHSVPETDVRRRYNVGLRNFLIAYQPIFDGWWLYNSTDKAMRLIAKCSNGTIEISDAELFQQIESSVTP